MRQVFAVSGDGQPHVRSNEQHGGYWLPAVQVLGGKVRGRGWGLGAAGSRGWLQ